MNSDVKDEVKRVTIALPREVREAAERAAERNRRSLSNYIRVLIEADTRETAVEEVLH